MHYNRYQKLIIFLVFFTSLAFAFHVAFSPESLAAGPPGSSGLPGADLTIHDIFNIIARFACWLWSVSLLLLVIFIIFAGIRYMAAGANQTRTTDAKKNLGYVIIGTIVVLGTFVIIATISYAIGVDLSLIPFDCSVSTGTPPAGATEYSCNVNNACVPTAGGLYTTSNCDNQCGTGTPPGTNNCNDPQALAAQYNEPYRRQNSTETDNLLSCIIDGLEQENPSISRSQLGSIFTFEQTNELCNYTRGNPVCGGCSYVVNSCHYGGRDIGGSGRAGAEAIDFGNEGLWRKIKAAAEDCGAGSVRCETSGSNSRVIPCLDGWGNSPNIHVSVTTVDCVR